MAYFLKKTNLKKGVYLQIYDSFRDPVAKQTKHKSFKALGYVDELKASGIADPIAHFKKEVDKLNKARKIKIQQDKEKKITDNPTRNIGCFLPKAVMNRMEVPKYVRYMNLMRDFGFDIYDIYEELVLSRMVSPCSKLKTWEEIMPSLYGGKDFSISQVYEAVEFIGEEYEKFIDIFNEGIKEVYGRKTSKVYFDCTNYYFEIDSEYEDKMKGPSKENRTEPIIGMALMLDENLIPIGMHMYPGNQSEKPELRDMISELKKRNNISGRTVQVADKGLNCTENIVSALLNKDGYIFSKSIRQLPQKELEWVFLKDAKYKEVYDGKKLKFKYRECIDEFEYNVKTANGTIKKVSIPEKRVLTWNPDLAEKQKHEIMKLMDKATSLCKSQAKKSEYGDAGKYVDFVSVSKATGELSDGNDVVATINEEKFKRDLMMAGYNLLVTSETKMSALDIYSTYHNLWRIEESFRILKGQLDARPVYLHKKESIYGHFLICYSAVVILRLLQFNVFKNELSYNSILNFIQNFECLPGEKRAINISSLKHVKDINDRLNLNLCNYYFSDKDLKKLFEMSI